MWCSRHAWAVWWSVFTLIIRFYQNIMPLLTLSTITSMACRKIAVTPLLTHWSYCSLAPSRLHDSVDVRWKNCENRLLSDEIYNTHLSLTAANLPRSGLPASGHCSGSNHGRLSQHWHLYDKPVLSWCNYEINSLYHLGPLLLTQIS